MTIGRPKGSLNKRHALPLLYQKRAEDKLIKEQSEVIEALAADIKLSADDISLDAAMKDCLYTIRYGAKRLKAMCVMGRGLSRDDVMNLKDLSSLIKSLKDEQGKILESVDDETLLKIVESKSSESSDIK